MLPPPPRRPLRVVIAGSRNCVSLTAVREAMLAQPFLISEVVSGNARGVDRLGEQWAHLAGVPVRLFPANWGDRSRGTYNVRAGRDRNSEMAEYADALVAVWDGSSTGTKHMIEQMAFRRKPVYIHPAL